MARQMFSEYIVSVLILHYKYDNYVLISDMQ